MKNNSTSAAFFAEDIYLLVDNETFVFNESYFPFNVSTPSLMRTYYKYVVPPLLFFCGFSVLINIRILLSVLWIRRPPTPTLHISLSLAGADAYTSLILGVGLIFNSYLPIVLDISLDPVLENCMSLVIEAMRLGGIYVTVAHLVALAFNHYLGILKPLHYLSIMTHRNTAICIAVLWISPITFFFVYFSSISEQGFQSEVCWYEFLLKLKFRIIFASIFTGSLLLMGAIYLHIYVIVKQHQSGRLMLKHLQPTQSRRHHRGRTDDRVGSKSDKQQRQQLARNVKAVFTTLYILGSFIVGWMPALVLYLVVCKDCTISIRSLEENHSKKVTIFYISCFCNFLVICKTLFNPIIYAARMNEIKLATQRMKSSICRSCIPVTDVSEQNLMYCNSTDAMGSQKSFVRTGTIMSRVGSITRTANGGPATNKFRKSGSRNHYWKKRNDTTVL